jgi:pimeloyl-ACP methyl ester carboxylesterase
MSSSPPRIVLVHGAWSGPWVFDRLTAQLRGRGFDVDTVTLPSVGGTVDMLADAEAITARLDAATGPVTLIAHSYGGIPTTQAGDHPAVARIVYIAAFALDEGESLQGSLGGSIPDFWGVADGMVSMGRSREERIAMASADLPEDAPADLAVALADMFQPQSLTAFTTPVNRVPAWKTKPTTYILAEQDQLVPPAFQEHVAARAGAHVIRVNTGHTPFEEDPSWFADLLVGVVTAERTVA